MVVEPVETTIEYLKFIYTLQRA